LCTMKLGKVDWLTAATALQLVPGGCPKNPPGNLVDPDQVCIDQIAAATDRLDANFNASMGAFKDIGRYPWPDTSQDAAALTGSIPTNPFIGYYQVKRYQESGGGAKPSSLFRATSYVLPKNCTKENFAAARQGN